MPRRIEGALLVGLMLAATPAVAAERQSVSVPAGRLGDAVIALGRQTGTSIGMSDQALANLPVRGVSGRMTAAQALDRLLSDTAAKATRIEDGVWRIVSVRRSPRHDVETDRDPPAVSEPSEDIASEIVVTASKRRIPLSQFAGPVEIVDAGSMRDDEAASGTAALIGHVASLSSTYVGEGRNKLFIRGIADSAFAGPTQATTGQYLGDMRLNYAAPDPDLRLYDIAAVEVLEGPQGTLYGAGSLGGIVRLVPNPPNLIGFGGRISAGASATEHGAPGGDSSATLNLPIVPGQLGLRVVGYAGTEGGYIDDTLRNRDDINRTHVAGGRAALRYAPADGWTIDLNGLYQHIQGDDAQYASRSAGKLAQQSPVRQNYATDYWLTSARIERQWNDMTFTSTAGIVHQALSERYDATQEGETPSVYHQRSRTEMVTTETRLARDLHDGLGWLVGFSYLDNRASIRRTLGPINTELPSTGVRNHVSEWTGFAEASVQPIDAIIVTAGGRVTSSKLTGAAIDAEEAMVYQPALTSLPLVDIARAEAQADRRETVFLPSIALSSDAIPGVVMYLRYQQGFRPGGLAIDDYRVHRFRNDRIGTVEAGFRKGVPGFDTVALSASIAYTDWRDIQADLTDRRGMPTTTNIGDGRIYTLEGRIVVTPVPGLVLDASAIWNDSRLDQPAAFYYTLSYEGRSLNLPNVASLGGRLAADYRLFLGNGDNLQFSASARYVGKSRLGIGPIFGQEQGNYVDTALSGSWSHRRLRFTVGLTNLFDATGNRFSLGTPFDLTADDYTPMRPRTVRAGVDLTF
jgi:outer membrane receptor protein involved in Fe transport